MATEGRTKKVLSSHRQHLTLSERRQEGDDRHLPKAGLVVGLAGVSRKTTLQCHRARGI